jgi:hypothetical protein
MEGTRRQNFPDRTVDIIISSCFSCSANRWLLVKDCQRALMDESEMIINYCISKIWSWAPGRDSIPRRTEWQTASR